VILLRRASDASEITRRVARHGLTTSLSHQTLLSLTPSLRQKDIGAASILPITRVDRGQLEGRRGCEGRLHLDRRRCAASRCRLRRRPPTIC